MNQEVNLANQQETGVNISPKIASLMIKIEQAKIFVYDWNEDDNLDNEFYNTHFKNENIVLLEFNTLNDFNKFMRIVFDENQKDHLYKTAVTHGNTWRYTIHVSDLSDPALYDYEDPEQYKQTCERLKNTHVDLDFRPVVQFPYIDYPHVCSRFDAYLLKKSVNKSLPLQIAQNYNQLNDSKCIFQVCKNLKNQGSEFGLCSEHFNEYSKKFEDMVSVMEKKFAESINKENFDVNDFLFSCSMQAESFGSNYGYKMGLQDGYCKGFHDGNKSEHALI